MFQDHFINVINRRRVAMGLRYLPMTETDKSEMLEAIGIKSTDELFSDIPASIRLNKELQLKKSTSEYELMRELTELSQKNMHTVHFWGRVYTTTLSHRLWITSSPDLNFTRLIRLINRKYHKENYKLFLNFKR